MMLAAATVYIRLVKADANLQRSSMTEETYLEVDCQSCTCLHAAAAVIHESGGTCKVQCKCYLL